MINGYKYDSYSVASPIFVCIGSVLCRLQSSGTSRDALRRRHSAIVDALNTINAAV